MKLLIDSLLSSFVGRLNLWAGARIERFLDEDAGCDLLFKLHTFAFNTTAVNRLSWYWPIAQLWISCLRNIAAEVAQHGAFE